MAEIAKEKAKELVEKFDRLLPCEGTTTGQTPIDCAKIVVKEIIESIVITDLIVAENQFIYWEEVLTELNKL